MDHADDEAHQGEGNPAETVGVQRHPVRKDGFESAHGDLGRLQSVVGRHHEGEADRPSPHATASADLVVEEGKNDERHAKGIEEHQHGDRRDDDRLQPEEADEVGDHREDDDPDLVGD